MPPNWAFALILVATSVGSAFIALALLSALTPRRGPPRKLAEVEPAMEEAVFLFDDQALIDASAPARALMEATPLRGSDWARLCAFLGPQFERFESEMARLAERGTIELKGAGPAPLRLKAELISGLARITLLDPEAEGQGRMVDALSLRAMEDELEGLREAADAMPVLAWRQDARGEVVWANRAYLLQSGALTSDAEDPCLWPLPRLFDLGPEPTLAQPGGPLPPARRMRLDVPGQDKPLWFDCHSLDTASSAINFALPADATVRAETALREFVQTLTKTFAHLPIGLAIFDRQRQLALFNPALIDLTTLGPDFLSGRPTLFSFLDRLREARMIPEPKDYRSWRQQMTELEKAASTGHYQETWTLPSGLTYQVTGRPHPDGAVALLIEDISAEVSLTRRFRSDLELGQAVVDSLPEAIAVFSPAGVLVMSNTAYARMWGTDPSTTLGEVGATESMRLWQAGSLPNPIWADARDFISSIGPRADWTGEAVLQTGQRITCRFQAIAGGATLAGFLPQGSDTVLPLDTRRLRRRRDPLEPEAGPDDCPDGFNGLSGAEGAQA
ncbi:PAS-domain containing protein [Frigidibacter sp.]|uniref:PAS-domain containing protein n=1 Tax=Frigidibacter sp. TaxID=2586418 RepID=UPI002736E282|nr:PAS-domain containing protein [Frigidibacter sp.]MDP3339137.1 PAS-domain containing protein [Frigidibacter sp.]